MNYKVDYHIHSYYSDGTMSPVELVRKYHDDEYEIISITDHDGIGGIQEALIAGEALKIKVVPGIELSTEYHGHEIHLLGYYFDTQNPQLIEKLNELRESRRRRNLRLLDKLKELGYDITIEELESRSKTGYIGKPNIARLMVEKGYISNVSEAYEPGKIFESPQLKEIRREKMDTIDAIKLVNTAGGIGVVAHPGKIKGLGPKGSDEYWNNMDSLIRDLKKAGLKGLECYHPSHTEEDALKFVVLAGKYHLHITEGSDFHGDK